MLHHCLSSDIFAEIAMHMLDARDLMRLFAEEEKKEELLLLLPRGATFCAARVLEPSELAWFAERGIGVALAQTQHTDAAGNRFWFENGTVPHRAGGLPAVEWANGDREWWEHGERHRDGGLPAIVELEIRTIPANIKGWVHQWYVRGKRHRDGGLPAYDRSDGERMWYVHGKAHRDDDLPAFEWADGSRDWCRRGILHRDGDQPAKVQVFRTTRNRNRLTWYKNGRIHRDNDLPAIQWDNGDLEWFQGMRHRDGDKPAIIRHAAASVKEAWYFWGRRYNETPRRVRTEG